MSTVPNTELNKELKDLLERAKKCDNKGRMYVFNRFKEELKSIKLQSDSEYEEICRKLGEYLEV